MSAIVGRTPAASEGVDGALLWLERDGVDEVPLRFADVDGRRYVFATSPEVRWAPAIDGGSGWRVRESSGVEWPVTGRRVLEAREADAARSALRRKYGERVWSSHFAVRAEVFRLDRRPAGDARPARERLRDEFDAVAPIYAARVRSNPLELRLKDRTAAELVARLAGADPLLEIGPGVGFETLPLLRAGHSIVAVDVSRGMLEELTSRAAGSGTAGRLTTREGSLGALGPALADFPVGNFAAAYSTFGAFNLEPEVREIRPALARLVRPGGTLTFTTLHPAGGAAVAWEFLAGRPAAALARCRPERRAAGKVGALDVHYRGPAFWDRALAPEFVRLDAHPVSVLTPPFPVPRLIRMLGPRGRRTARRWDDVLSGVSILAPLAEWMLLTYRRAASAGDRSTEGG